MGNLTQLLNMEITRSWYRSFLPPLATLVLYNHLSVGCSLLQWTIPIGGHKYPSVRVALASYGEIVMSRSKPKSGSATRQGACEVHTARLLHMHRPITCLLHQSAHAKTCWSCCHSRKKLLLFENRANACLSTMFAAVAAEERTRRRETCAGSTTCNHQGGLLVHDCGGSGQAQRYSGQAAPTALVGSTGDASCHMMYTSS